MGTSMNAASKLFGVAAIALSVLLSGCAASGEDGPLAFKEEPLAPLYNEALNLLGEGKYKQAAKKFEEVDRQYPYSQWARRAILMAAFAYYESGQYEESISASQRFLTLHPGNEDAAYAQYLIAQSYYEQIPDVTRDQRATERALRAYEEVARRFPETEYARDSRNKIEEARDQLAGKEMEIGRYYLERNNQIAAVNRFKTVVKDYQTTAHVEEALMRLTEAYMALGIVSEAQTAAAILGHNYPASPWYKDAYALLQSGGLEPREDKQSWLSQVWRVVGGGDTL